MTLKTVELPVCEQKPQIYVHVYVHIYIYICLLTIVEHFNALSRRLLDTDIYLEVSCFKLHLQSTSVSVTQTLNVKIRGSFTHVLN